MRIYENVTRRIFEQRDGIAWLILDARLDDVPNWRRQPHRSAAGLAAQHCRAGALWTCPPTRWRDDRCDYNAACTEGAFKPLEIDGLTTHGPCPAQVKLGAADRQARRSWAWPIISANVFTFGGLKVDANARVLDLDGDPIAGLYAAGETMGIYYRTYTGSTSVLRGAVFGRQAALHACGRTP